MGEKRSKRSEGGNSVSVWLYLIGAFIVAALPFINLIIHINYVK